MELTAGTLKPVPENFQPDGPGRLDVLTRFSGQPPDGRTCDDSRFLRFAVSNGLVTSVDQYIDDPAAVTAFWT
jgi:hypothetical protein